LVPFPIGFFLLCLLFDLASCIGEGSHVLVRSAAITMALGILLALLAAVPGFVDWSAIRADHPARKTASLHMLLNAIVIGLYILNWILRREMAETTTTALGPLLLSLVGIGLLAVSGYLGGT